MNRETRALTAVTTPRLVARLLLIADSGAPDSFRIRDELLGRRCGSGGFLASRQAPSPDLLATALARFALFRHPQADRTQDAAAADLAFIASCWTDAGLFAPSPSVETGDAEHTFYGLLALGTCR